MSTPNNADPSLGQLSFLAWTRRGASVNLTTADPVTVASPAATTVPARGALSVAVSIAAKSGDQSLTLQSSQQPTPQQVELYGPADIFGIDPRHVARTIPNDGTANFEPNYFAAIELDQPDFLWRFTPVAPNAERLRPWLTLIVLADGEFQDAKTPPHPLPSIEVAKVSSLPALEESWAWAHTQIVGTLDQAHSGSGSGGAATIADDTLAKIPGKVISRLICPRQLAPNTAYTAFLVPAFDIGVQAGLGQFAAPGAVAPTHAAPAWTSASAEPLTLPVYSRFSFHTSNQGDFESLARRLRPRPLPADVGTWPLGVDQPGWGLAARADTLPLGGALRPPGSAEHYWTDVKWVQDTPPTEQSDLQTGLAQLVNVPIRQVDPQTPGSDGVIAPDPANYNPQTDDPIIAPPLYGRWHAAVQAAAPASPTWLNQLNLDPRTRGVAGLGAQIVRQQREQLMAAAWQQIASVDRANQQLRQAQLNRSVLRRVYVKHFLPTDNVTALFLTSGVHTRIRAGSQTVHASIAQSRAPTLAYSAAFRRVARPLGPLRRRQGFTISSVGGGAGGSGWASGSSGAAGGTIGAGSGGRGLYSGLVERLNSGDIALVPPPAPPPGMVPLDTMPGFSGQPSQPGTTTTGSGSGRPFWFLVLVLALVLACIGIALLFLGQVAAGAAAIVFAIALIALSLIGLRTAGGASQGPTVGQVGGIALTPGAFADPSPRPTFVVVPPGTAPQPATLGAGSGVGGGAGDSADAHLFRVAAIQLTTSLRSAPTDTPPRPPASLDELRTTVIARLDPTITVAERMGAVVQVAPQLGWAPADPLTPIMAAPDFPQPMYLPLRDWSQDWLLPGLQHLPPETVTLVEADHAFIEAYMVGLNYEMARQLLWNEYPTDQRGSYFRQFWEVNAELLSTANAVPTDLAGAPSLEERLKDIPPINTWPTQNNLGDNRNGPQHPDTLVLLVRGELLRRYPNAIIYACPAAWDAEAQKHILSPTDATEMHPLFRGTLPPDVTFFGFDLTMAQAKGSGDESAPGWFFVFQQHSSEPVFGFEPAPEPYTIPTITSWDTLTWANFASDASSLAAMTHAPIFNAKIQGLDQALHNTWGQDAGQTARIALRWPARVAIHAETMLAGVG